MFDPRYLSLKKFFSYVKERKRFLSVERIWMSIWEEHCTECAVPLCYEQCCNYKKRSDGKCSRIQKGILRNYKYKGVLRYGLDCTFQKWGKIESRWYPYSCSLIRYRILSDLNYYIYLFLEQTDRVVHRNKENSLLRKYRLSRNNYLLRHYTNLFPSAFYIECFLINKQSVNFHIQIDDNISNHILYSKFHTIHLGENRICIPFEDIHFDYTIKPWEYAARLRIFVAPISEDTQTNVVFTFLNFIRTKDVPPKAQKREYVKCVAWDLDNTIWDGIFSEIGQDVVIRNNIVETVIDLDSKGIINTVISKNDYERTAMFLERIGLLDYFVLPAINWGSKSENLQRISSSLGLSLDSFVFIDDDMHERNEVKVNCPNVRVYDVKDIESILKFPEFNPPTSVGSSARRKQYQEEIRRKCIYLSNFPLNYDEYLKHLNIQINFLSVRDSSVYKRCFELLSRSNQYNLRTVRYTEREFKNLIDNPDMECYAVEAKDRYGVYGIICFFSLEFENRKCKVLDLVYSCRIARKNVEREIIKEIQKYAIHRNCKELILSLIVTPKNGPLAQILNSIPFIRIEYKVSQIDYSLDVRNHIQTEGITTIEDITRIHQS